MQVNLQLGAVIQAIACGPSAAMTLVSFLDLPSGSKMQHLLAIIEKVIGKMQLSKANESV